MVFGDQQKPIEDHQCFWTVKNSSDTVPGENNMVNIMAQNCFVPVPTFWESENFWVSRWNPKGLGRTWSWSSTLTRRFATCVFPWEKHIFCFLSGLSVVLWKNMVKQIGNNVEDSLDWFLAQDSKDVFVLGSIEDITVALEDSLVTISTIATWIPLVSALEDYLPDPRPAVDMWDRFGQRWSSGRRICCSSRNIAEIFGKGFKAMISIQKHRYFCYTSFIVFFYFVFRHFDCLFSLTLILSSNKTFRLKTERADLRRRLMNGWTCNEIGCIWSSLAALALNFWCFL